MEGVLVNNGRTTITLANGQTANATVLLFSQVKDGQVVTETAAWIPQGSSSQLSVISGGQLAAQPLISAARGSVTFAAEAGGLAPFPIPDTVNPKDFPKWIPKSHYPAWANANTNSN